MASSNSALWAAGYDESVEVNQRALIDKILARYSGEFTVFRELLQNSDDAGACSVEIRFETKEYLSQEKGDEPKLEDLPDLETTMVHQWTFKNNGMQFREEDWNRLKKIVDGNPDEEKIGAFGVGFYSLFSITEEPWVTSGGKWMNFYWKDKKDQLYVRRGTGGDAVDAWTTFQMTLRDPGPMPPAFEFTRFLVSSIAFMTHLSEVSVYFDDRRLVKLSKNRSETKEVPMLKELKCMSPEEMMNVKSIETTALQIKAEVVELVYKYKVGSLKPSVTSKTDILKSSSHEADGFFSPLSDGFEVSPTPEGTQTQAPVAHKGSIHLLTDNFSSVVLTIFAANVDVRLNEKMAGELLRATKKNLPSRLRYEFIYTGKDEYDSSVRAEEEEAYTESVFQGLRADLEGTGSTRVFIGHATGQTTGFGGHMATRFIPTVERESIDLVNHTVAVWNKELLYVGGFLARSAYELEMDAIKTLWEDTASANDSGGRPDEDVQTTLRGRALHALKFFTFHPSTPSPVVSNLMQTAFFECATTLPFSIISSDGVRNAMQVYNHDPEFSGFLKHLPRISEDVFNDAKTMIATLCARGMIQSVTFKDILKDLRLGPLNETETVACLKWWIGVTKRENSLDFQWRSQLLDAAAISIPGPNEKMMKLSDARTFLNSKTGESIIPTDGPLPSTVLPMNITSSFDAEILSSVFPWGQLSMADWLRHLTDPEVAAANAEFDITNSASWAERVLSVLAQAWPSLPETAQDDVIEVLNAKSCVPTSTGLKVPDQAYFPSVKLFRDLPIVTMPSGDIVEGNLEEVLQSLGVRKNVEIQIICERMTEAGDLTTYDLVKYLAPIQSTLTSEEIERLRQSSAFLEESTEERQSTSEASKKARVMDLYEPVEVYRELGLPVFDWGADNQWKPESDEAKFVYSLGLRRAPPLSEILNIVASGDPTVRTRALTFFLDNLSDRYNDYDPRDFNHLAFIPAVLGSEKMLAKPSEVCTDPKWSALGFAVVDLMLPDGAAFKLGLEHRPRDFNLVTLLERSPPEDGTTARKWFEILSDCVFELPLDYLRILAETPFVPVESTGYNGVMQRLQPKRCFLGKQPSELHSKLFAFVDFGTRANDFLKCCFASEEPCAEDIAQVLLADPWRVYELANGRKNYLTQLRELAKERSKLEEGTIFRMKRSKILLGSRRGVEGGGNASIGDGRNLQDELLYPSEVVIIDDTNAYQLFGDRIYCAPQDDLDDIIEELYSFLGSPNLRSLIREDHSTSHELPDSELAAEIRQLILDRLPLFLHEQSSRTKLSLDWLNNEKNIIVKVFEKITVTKSLHHGDIHESTSHDASAIAKQDGNGPIELFLASRNERWEMHEISTPLCQVIFESPEAHDTVLFMTILRSDLTRLENLGYPVEKMLRKKAETSERSYGLGRHLHPKRLVAFLFCLTFLRKSNDIPPRLKSVPPLLNPSMRTTQPKVRSPNTPIPGPSSQATPGNTGPKQTSKRSCGPGHNRPPNRSDAPLSWSTPPPKSQDIPHRSKSDHPLPNPSMPTTRPKTWSLIPAPSSQSTSGNTGPEQTLKRSYGLGLGHNRTPNCSDRECLSAKPGPPRDGITPLSNMAYSIDMAIKRCTPERGNLLRNLANDINKAVKVQAPESDNLFSELANDINLTIEANVPESDIILKRLLNNINAAIGTSSSERDKFLRNLANNVEMAIEAGAPASGNPPANQEEMKSLYERYCDVTGETMDLVVVGNMHGIDVYAASDFPGPGLLLKQKRDVLARFLGVLEPLVAVYKIPPTSLHIFADKEWRFISFNRRGNLFLNLRYFEEYYDNDVEQGNSGEALIFWYFVLAHGIAHNLVDKHDLKHESSVSVICGTHLQPLIDHLSRD